MALIKTLAEIQAVLPRLVSTISDFAQLPNFDKSEAKYITPLIGSTLLGALQTAYDGNTLTAEQEKLVKHIRLVSAAYAFLDEAGLYVLNFSDSGLKKTTTGGNEPIYKWNVDELKQSLIEAANEGTEVLLNYLFTNKASYAEWTASAEYTKLSSLLIKTGTELSENYTVYQPQRSLWVMRNLMADVQTLYVQEDIGKDLLVYLRDVATPTDDEKNCIALLKKAIAFYTVAAACKQFSVSFTDNGFTILGQRSVVGNADAYNQATDMQLLQLKIDECEKMGAAFFEKAKNEMVTLYSDAGVVPAYKTAFEAGPLTDYTSPEEKATGNDTRKIFSF